MEQILSDIEKELTGAKQTVPLTVESLSFLKASNSILDQHKTIDEAIRTSMAMHMLMNYGIDLGAEDWTLDLDQGVLERKGEE